MRAHKSMMNVLIGIVLIVVGLYLSIELILEFATAVLGLILIIVGMSFLTKRW